MVDIFDISDNKMKQVRSITYSSKGNIAMTGYERIYVKISDDLKQVVFSNGLEHYILKDRS